jgi:hypothetical protein
MTRTKTVEVALKSEKEELKTTKEALEAELMETGYWLLTVSCTAHIHVPCCGVHNQV